MSELDEKKLERERWEVLTKNITEYAYTYNVNPDGTIRGVWISDSFLRIFKLTKEEIITRGGWKTLIHPEDLPKALEHVARVVEGHIDHCEMRMVTADGEVRWVRNHAIPVIENGRTVRIHGVAEDITEFKKIQEELNSQKKFLESIFATIQDGLSVLDSELNILYVNDVMRRWYRENLPLEGKKCYQAYHNRNQPCDPCPTIACMKSGRTERELVPGLPGSGVELIELFSYPQCDPQTGKVKMVVEFVRDITEKRRLEKQLIQAQKMEAIGRLAGGVAHDFNNILSVIIGRSDLLLSNLPDESPIRAEVSEILAAGKRAEALTRQLLAFSRRQVLEPTVLDINQVIASVRGLLERVIGEDIVLQCHLDTDLWMVKIDQSQLEQILMNLVVNARDAMPHGGTITIETENTVLDEDYSRRHLNTKPGQYVLLSVSDTGVGMDQNVLEHIFEPFFTTKEPGRGTGLGLSTVHGIVTQSGGHIWVYSEPGKGSTFKIYLPRCLESPKEAKVYVEKPLVGGREKILVVEDNEAVRSFLEKALEVLGYIPVMAQSCTDARGKANQHGPFDLLITDVVLVDGNGHELSRQLTSKWPDMKVLFISGYTANTIVHNELLDEKINFLAKPFTISQLARKIRSVLDLPSK